VATHSNDDYVRLNVERLRSHKFTLLPWHPSPALLPRSNKGASSKFHGQAYDQAEYELVEDGWSHDHCPFCWVTIEDREYEGAVTTAFTDGYNWVCPPCFARYLEDKLDP